MPDLKFKILGVEPVVRGLTPLLQFNLEISNEPPEEMLQGILLHTQIQIQSPQRAYKDQEKADLKELFGAPEQWGQTLRNRLWTIAHTTVSPFQGRAETALPVTCTYDLNVTATKYFYALEGGEVPLLFLFSGTVFYASADGRLQVQPISWSQEATYRMPLAAWQGLMDGHYPNSAWVPLQRDIFDRLYAYKRDHGLASWDEAIERLLLPAAEPEEAMA